MPEITIDGKKLMVENGLTIIQAASIANIQVPHFCYHEKLRIAGNCRMCLVEVEKSPRLVASCAMEVSDGMVIHTQNERVKKAREGVMEFLLINHPLDCPICDQGGECDLQDQAYKYGKADNRFLESKRSVSDKNIGPLIKTHMTRCIHCMRCVRFMDDIAGERVIGSINRGEDTEITTFLEEAISSELSGNIIDICPVGALNSKPYAFKARKWELTSTPSIDLFDAVGSNIRVDSRGLEVMRVLPRVNEDINEQWISDKVRFSYDGLKIQRIDRCYIRKDGILKQSTYTEALSEVVKVLKCNKKVGAIAGKMTDCETMWAMKKLLKSLNSTLHDFNIDNLYYDKLKRCRYLFNTSIAKIEEADVCILIGTDIKNRAPILNARVRKSWLNFGLKIFSIGSKNLNYPYVDLGSSVTNINSISDIIKTSPKPMLIIGDGVLMRKDAKEILEKIYSLDISRDNWNGFNILHNNASSVGALDLGFSSDEDVVTESDILFILGADEVELNNNSFKIYIGHHGDEIAQQSDIIIAAPAYTEKTGTYVNLEGRVQNTYQAVQSISTVEKIKHDAVFISQILKEINEESFEDIQDIRNAMIKEFPHLGILDTIPNEKQDFRALDVENKIVLSDDISTLNNNYYMTHSISRFSKTMAECSRIFYKNL